MSQYAGKVNAPEFPDGLDWLNADHPPKLSALKGKIVLLDFWTYCCINCMHILPDLQRLERKYAAELVVIGIHSAKFPNEKHTENIRQAVLRHGIEHPVVNDAAMILWRQYGVRAWPTIAVIDPLGKVVGGLTGEGFFESLDRFIADMIAEFDSRGQIDRRPARFPLEASREPRSILCFPGKVIASEHLDLLFVSDSNHNRIVISDLNGKIEDVIGTGAAGLKDGSFDDGRLNRPQGLTLVGETLYIADTENHAIRRADLRRRTVETIAGNGAQSHQVNPPYRPGSAQELNSPWDLVEVGNDLYIAMAGSHQVWKMNLATLTIGPYAGSAREACIDGPLKEAALAQPSGIATDGAKLYFADSETSSLRAADLDAGGSVNTLVGTDLFEFGDQDGSGDDVRLQHPLGVAFHDGVLYVADTYNHKIKKIFPRTRTAVTFAGSGHAGYGDGEKPLFREPGGVSVAGANLYVADTDNHAVRIVNLQSGRTETLRFSRLEALTGRSTADWAGDVVELDAVTLKPGEAHMAVDVQLPAGFDINREAPNRVELEVDGACQAVRPSAFPAVLHARIVSASSVRADVQVFYCAPGKEGLCYVKQVRFIIPVRVDGSASRSQIDLICKV